MSIRLTYDKEANAVYLGVRDIPPGSVSKTVELISEPHPVEEWVLADLDEAGNLLGLEFLSLESFLKHADIAHDGLNPEALVSAYKTRASN